MKVHRIQIEQQMARIDVDSQKASLSIETSRRTMTVEGQRPQMSVQREAPSIDPDMEQFRENVGLESILTLTQKNAARAKAHVEQTIRQHAADADYIGTLPSSGNPVAQVAKNRMLADKTPEICSGQVPDGPVAMEGNPGKISIDWSAQDLRINWDEFQSPVITVEPKASVDVHLVQEPSVEYTVVELEIPPERGKAIDAEA